jgi:hypothetical protein
MVGMRLIQGDGLGCIQDRIKYRRTLSPINRNVQATNSIAGTAFQNAPNRYKGHFLVDDGKLIDIESRLYN